MPTDETSFKLGTITHYNTVTNGDLADYNPLGNVRLTTLRLVLILPTKADSVLMGWKAPACPPMKPRSSWERLQHRH